MVAQTGGHSVDASGSPHWECDRRLPPGGSRRPRWHGRGLPRPGPGAGALGRAQAPGPEPREPIATSVSASWSSHASPPRSSIPTSFPSTTPARPTDQLYLAMRYVEGTDLKRLLKDEGRLDSARAIAICVSGGRRARRRARARARPSRRQALQRLARRARARLSRRLRSDQTARRSGTGLRAGALAGHASLRRPRTDRGQGCRRQSRPVLARLPAPRVPDRRAALPPRVGGGHAFRPPGGAAARAARSGGGDAAGAREVAGGALPELRGADDGGA